MHVYGALASCLPVLNVWGRWCVSEEYKQLHKTSSEISFSFCTVDLFKA